MIRVRKLKRNHARNIRWDLIFVINGLILLIASLLVFTSQAYGLVGVGSQIDCFAQIPVASITYNVMDSNDSEAQTFTLTQTQTISAVKINAYRDSGVDGWVLNAHIAGTTGSQPDYNNIYASTTWDTSLLPILDTGLLTNNNFSCDPDNDSGQVVIFDPPVALSAGLYAFIIDGVTGMDNSGVDMQLIYTISNDYYASGIHWECNVPTACTRTTPATWDLTGGVNDVHGMSWFDNIVVVDPVNVDATLTNFLTQMGLNTDMGKAVFAVIIACTMFITLATRKAPPLIVLGVGGMISIPVVGFDLIPGEIVMSIIGIIGIALIYFVIRGFGKVGDDG